MSARDQNKDTRQNAPQNDQEGAENVFALKIADASLAVRHVFVRDLRLGANIGVYAHEKHSEQPIVINIDLTVAENSKDLDDNLDNVVCYDQIVQKVKAMITEDEHTQLVETLAENIASSCLEDSRVQVARIRVEKLNAIPEAGSVGVEIERKQAET